jgi:hypothetical protein
MAKQLWITKVVFLPITRFSQKEIGFGLFIDKRKCREDIRHHL